jgi:hypothetical protein
VVCVFRLYGAHELPRARNLPETAPDGTFQQAFGPADAFIHWSNSFQGPRNSYKAAQIVSFYFEEFADGIPHATRENRRSGAQRGAPENNFGQRFSWAPLA